MRDKNYTFLEIARVLSELGTCDRNRVGAVIVCDGRCVTWGYNGAPPGLPHCEDNAHGWAEYQSGEPTYMLEAHGCRNATHAEANALAFAARQGISTDGGTLYVTLSPCLDCARLLIAAGISEVFYDSEYREPAGRELLQQGGVHCHQLTTLR